MKTPPPPPTQKLRVPPEVDPGHAKEEYLRVLRALGGTLSVFDESLLVDYANTHAQIIELRETVRMEGNTLTGPKGGEYINPTVNILISRQSHMAALRRDLFFTPRARGEKSKPSGKALSILEKLTKANNEED